MIPHNEISALFYDFLNDIGRQGDIGYTDFKQAYETLMPVQKQKLITLCGDNFSDYLNKGSIICILITYFEDEINTINQYHSDGTPNKELWTIYANAYKTLNRLLNNIAQRIAVKCNGISIPATIEGIVDSIDHVSEYYFQTVSHRQIAEYAGLGWRGKNGLLIHPTYSCAFRLASIITPSTYLFAQKLSLSCGECKACLDQCGILQKKEKLDHYQEACRKFLIKINIPYEVCGKCIYACYNHSIYKNQFNLPKSKLKY
ncbi:MAG: hypothetical protein BAJALOKI1v1_1100001 [Promethearchaeota archaeon]|nr:MAG: hypothetical protein BAJALOKI1v1_1100001 [Candidatus Lokiarchaeota archaeon]